MRTGDIVRTSEGKNLQIDKIEEPVLVYNFEVEGFHTYYVFDLGVLVHNTCENATVGKSGKSSELLLKAEKARDDLIVNTVGGKKKSMVIGAYDVKTGDVVADFAGPIPDNISTVLIERANKIGGIGSKGLTERNTIGVCAEFRTANQLLLNGSDISNIRFTKPIRPRTGEIRPNCNNCLEMFSDILDN